jgi:hypothetical protein
MTGMSEIDATVAHPARRYNYWLGGKDNFAADRESGDQLQAMFPKVRLGALANRALLQRATRFLAAEAGVRQFLDIGTGLPTADNTHEVAQGVAPESRVVYVDNDPMVMVHARALLTSSPQGRTAYIEADLNEPARILADPATRATLDFDRPVGLMMLALLHLITDDEEARAILDRLVGALAPGSFVALSHACLDVDVTHTAVKAWNESGTPHPLRARTGAEIEALFDGLELVEPGIVSCARWRPEPNPWGEPQETMTFCGVARKLSA